MTDIVRASEEAVRGPIGAERRRPAQLVEARRPSTDSWVIERDGESCAGGMLVAYGDVPDFWGAVRPTETGRGLGAALIDLAEARARERGAGAAHRHVRRERPVPVTLLTSRGYHDVRHYVTMHVRLTEAPRPAWPEGVRVERFRTIEEARAFYDALNDAFQDEWGWAQMDFEEWYRLRIEAADADDALVPRSRR